MSVATNQTCDRKTRWEMVGKVAFDVSSARFSSSVLVVLSGETLITVGDVGESGPSAKEQGAGRTTGLPVVLPLPFLTPPIFLRFTLWLEKVGSQWAGRHGLSELVSGLGAFLEFTGSCLMMNAMLQLKFLCFTSMSSF